jgi:ectoine hydroxylase-related dioxygenase (phytanoyl-CoA dioxygenase family)
MSNICTVGASTSSAIVNEILARDGCIVIDGLLSGRQVEALELELRPHFDRTENCHGDFYGHITKRLSGLIAKSPVCQALAIHPGILAVMDRFLLDSCREYQLNLTQAIQIGPGEPQQAIHRDDLMFNFEHPGREAMINTMWAVDDFTLENGATHVVPGSHTWPLDRQPLPEEEVQGVMKRGSVLIWLGSLQHGGGANRTQTSRTGVVISYSLGWLRQAENSYLAVPREIAKDLPERLQRLLGYFVHQPNVGCVEGQDPIRLLHGESILDARFEEFLPDEVKPLLEAHRARLLQAA